MVDPNEPASAPEPRRIEPPYHQAKPFESQAKPFEDQAKPFDNQAKPFEIGLNLVEVEPETEPESGPEPGAPELPPFDGVIPFDPEADELSAPVANDAAPVFFDPADPAGSDTVSEPRPRSRRGRGRRGSGRGEERPAENLAPVAPLAAVPTPSAPPAPAAEPFDETRPRRAARPERGAERSAERGPERRSAGGNGGAATHAITDDEISAVREMVYTVPAFAAPPARVTEERKIAMFCDLENVALGVRDSEIKKFDITLILERLLEKGKIIVKKAYADWERYSDYKRPFHEAGIELLDIPQKYYSGKNSADIKMVVDAMDVCYAKDHLDTFVIVSGDSDFTPLVSKLKENDKHVIGIGVKNSSSNLLIDNCDEFIFYEDIWRDQQAGPDLAGLSKKSAEVFGLMIDAIQALTRENKDVLWGSMIKQTMQRKKPSFNEGYFGYSSFSELLEDAERKGILKLKKDQRSGTYVVTGFAKR